MEDRSVVLTAACVGAVAGGVWGWLYLTKNGTQARERLESTFGPAIDDGQQLLSEVMAVANALRVPPGAPAAAAESS